MEHELIEIENNSILQQVNDRSFVIKRKAGSRHKVEGNPVAGYGRCRACDCKGYISKHNGSHECKTCGHHYDRHN